MTCPLACAACFVIGGYLGLMIGVLVVGTR